MRRILLAVLPFLPLPALADTVTDFTLENVLQVLVIEVHRAPAVTQMVWYRTGAADEAPGHSGIAHFFEHLLPARQARARPQLPDGPRVPLVLLG